LNISISELLEAGVHFGHQTKRWNPKMKPYIYQERAGIYIINLQKTQEELKKACDAMIRIVGNGGKILFVGTKRQAKEAIREIATQTENYFVTERWLGGMLTNNATIRASIDKLESYEQMEKDGTFEKISKKEISGITKEKHKLYKNLDGIRGMKELAQALFVVDIKREAIAVSEARKLGIPVFAIVDTNCDPDEVDYVIPGNDDAIRSIQYILSKIQEAVQLGKEKHEQFRVSREKRDAERKKELEARKAAAKDEGVEKKEGQAPARPVHKPRPRMDRGHDRPQGHRPPRKEHKGPKTHAKTEAAPAVQAETKPEPKPEAKPE
jgi:small subunit ribosomal protein S2